MKISVESPSNIALVKYWGKLPNQIPTNTSLSLTLEHCKTSMDIELVDDCQRDVSVYFHGEKKDSFRPKVEKLINLFRSNYPEFSDSSFIIKSTNTFPHSAGIASSASSMSALALALVHLSGDSSPELASHYARLGSGSACRSVYPNFVSWGEHPSIKGSSNKFATELPMEQVHQSFYRIYDSIAIVNSGEKSVSSSAGHSLMENHLFKEARTIQAQTHIEQILKSLTCGDWESFGKIVENEALTLHGLMMNSSPSFILLKPNTLKIIDQVRTFRAQTGAHIYFTLDAGPNVHLIYGNDNLSEIRNFIKKVITPLCENSEVIHDEMSGLGSCIEK